MRTETEHKIKNKEAAKQSSLLLFLLAFSIFNIRCRFDPISYHLFYVFTFFVLFANLKLDIGLNVSILFIPLFTITFIFRYLVPFHMSQPISLFDCLLHFKYYISFYEGSFRNNRKMPIAQQPVELF